MFNRHLPRVLVVVSILYWLTGCATAGRVRMPKNPDPVIQGEVTEEKAQKALSMKIGREIEFLQGNAMQYKEQVLSVTINGKTYYYKFYDEFPEGAEKATVTVEKTDTLSPSYTAEAKYRKIRYQTKYLKSRSKASSDADFIRDEGIQKNTYAFDGKVWRLRSSIFEITKSSLYREDQWVASQRIKRIEEEKPEYFVDKLRTLFGLLE
jgi:hypothetical protein